MKEKKTSDEMFKELGYKISEEVDKKKDKYCCGIQLKKKGIVSEKYIEFYYYHKKILLYKRDYINNKIMDSSYTLDMQELQAINKKCEELGWL